MAEKGFDRDRAVWSGAACRCVCARVCTPPRLRARCVLKPRARNMHSSLFPKLPPVSPVRCHDHQPKVWGRKKSPPPRGLACDAGSASSFRPLDASCCTCDFSEQLREAIAQPAVFHGHVLFFFSLHMRKNIKKSVPLPPPLPCKDSQQSRAQPRPQSSHFIQAVYVYVPSGGTPRSVPCFRSFPWTLPFVLWTRQYATRRGALR